MKLGQFLIAKAILSFVFALGALLAPVYLIALHGAALDALGVVMTRYYGALLVGIGVVCWSLRNAADSEARRGILLALLIADAIGFIIALRAQLAGLVNILGWVDIGIWFALVIGLGYFRFFHSSSA